MVSIGVLAVQGAFSEHINALKKVLFTSEFKDKNVRLIEVRSADDITEEMVGIILPGGESTAAARQLSKDDFGEKLKGYVMGHMTKNLPIVWGTCSGLIMLADHLENQMTGGQYHIGGLDVTVSRNFFGRQVNSFETEVLLSEGFSKNNSCYGVFIRAPAVISCDKEKVDVLATIRMKEKSTEPIIVAVQQKNIIATSFHPELTEDLMWHKHFLQLALSQS